MPFTLSISTLGETIVERRLLGFASNLEQPQDALEEIGTILREVVEQQFATEGGHASGGWPKLSDARVAYKAQKGLDPHILRAADDLMNALTRKFDPAHIEQVEGDSLVFGASVPYGIYHQSSKARTKIPFRPPVALTEGDKRKMVKAVQAVLVGGREQAVWGA